MLNRQRNFKNCFHSSTEGGVDIEKVAIDTPEKILTTKTELKENVDEEVINNIIKPFRLDNEQKN